MLLNFRSILGVVPPSGIIFGGQKMAVDTHGCRWWEPRISRFPVPVRYITSGNLPLSEVPPSEYLTEYRRIPEEFRTVRGSPEECFAAGGILRRNSIPE